MCLKMYRIVTLYVQNKMWVIIKLSYQEEKEKGKKREKKNYGNLNISLIKDECK